MIYNPTDKHIPFGDERVDGCLCTACTDAEQSEQIVRAPVVTAAEARKRYPIGTGVIDYFPDAIAEVARVSYEATQQHHPGEPMHWDRTKSPDDYDCALRHLLRHGHVDSDKLRHTAKAAWRVLAMLQKELESAKETGRV